MVQRYIEGGYGASEMEEDAQGDWVSYEDYAELKEAAEKALAVLEDYEVQIDGEWGACWGLERLYADGQVDDVLPLLKGLLRD